VAGDGNDDQDARRRRARQLRREIDERSEATPRERPPRSPYEFIEREMREHGAREPDEGGKPGGGAAEHDEEDNPPSG
jgi:hypothetical protein